MADLIRSEPERDGERGKGERKKKIKTKFLATKRPDAKAVEGQPNDSLRECVECLCCDCKSRKIQSRASKAALRRAGV